MVTAGLKCPPDTWPNMKTAASSPSPNANGTTSRLLVGTAAAVIAPTEAYPSVRNRVVPTNSAR